MSENEKPDHPRPDKASHSNPPPAGPHAKPDLTDPIKTPGSGALPPRDAETEKDIDTDPGTG
jgi:hypothetical protein